MKIKHADGRGSSRIQFTSVFSTCLLAGAALLGLGGGDSGAGTFPAGNQSEQTFSIGVFRMTITDPAIQSWFSQLGATWVTYPGYKDPTSTDPSIIAMASPAYTLSSPVMFDRQDTTIGESAGYVRPLVGSTLVGNSSALPAPSAFPLPYPPPTWPVPVLSLGYSSFTCPSGTPHIPLMWIIPPPAGIHREMLTHIESFALSAHESCPITDPRVPTCGTPGSGCPDYPMVIAGPAQGVVLPSIGIVHSIATGGLPANDFPARSFFNIYVEVNLPAITGTRSAGMGIFPTSPSFPLGAMVLYNDCDSPLVIQNLNISSNPPSVVYIHGSTPAVAMRFKYTNPGYWTAGQVAGMLTLAGHGVGLGCAKSASDLLDQVFGPTNAPIAGMPIGWMYPSCNFPAPNAVYSSLSNIDVLNITDPLVGTVKMRNISLGNLLNGIALPPLNSSATYSTANASVNLEVSLDLGQSWSPATGNGPVTMSLLHTNDSYGWQSYDTEVTAMDLSCSVLGLGLSFHLRESPTKASLGVHKVRPAQGGYEIASSFDISYEATFDSVQWVPGEKPLNQQVQYAPCGAAGAQLGVQRVGPNLIISWLGSGYQLQGSPTLVPSAWGNIAGGSSSPVTVPLASGIKFFRLTCQ